MERTTSKKEAIQLYNKACGQVQTRNSQNKRGYDCPWLGPKHEAKTCAGVSEMSGSNPLGDLCMPCTGDPGICTTGPEG